MYTRITKTGGRQYLQLVESFRNDSGKVRTRVVANLGRLDQITPEQLDPLINGLNRAVGRAHNTSSQVIQESGLSFGDVFALHELWRGLGIDTALKRAMRSSRRAFDAEALIRAMVFNRLCDPTSKSTACVTPRASWAACAGWKPSQCLRCLTPSAISTCCAPWMP